MTCASSGVDLDDIIQISYFALCDAIKAYKIDAEYKFTTYIKYPLLNHFRTLVGLRSSKRNPLDNALSLNQPIDYENGGSEHIDLLVDPNSEKEFDVVINNLFQSELHNALECAISKLSEKRASVVRKRWFEGKQQRQIAHEMNVSPQAIHCIEHEALRKMRNEIELQKLHNEVISEFAYKNTGLKWFKKNQGSSVEYAIIRAEEIFEQKSK